MKKLAWLTFSGLFMLGCGGAGPAPAVDRSTPVSKLSDQQRQDFCAWSTAKLGGDNKEYDCGGEKFTIKPAAECASTLKDVPAGCDATYGDIADCAEAQSDDFCSGKWVTNAGCQKTAACDMVSTM